eukprot:4729044-Pleurochrysis_carterae.AAC.9
MSRRWFAASASVAPMEWFVRFRACRDAAQAVSMPAESRARSLAATWLYGAALLSTAFQARPPRPQPPIHCRNNSGKPG